MTKVALTKLLLLVILAFIICLPEFFTLYKVSKVNFKCHPYQPCEQRNQVKESRSGKPAEDKRIDICDPSVTPAHVNWERICAQESESILTDLEPRDGEGKDDPKIRWFMCETDKDMTEVDSNISSSGQILLLEVSVELQYNNAEYPNLTLYGYNNQSSLHLHPPDKEADEMGDDDRPMEAFYCCLPPLPTSKSSNQSQCLLWLSNQTVLTGTAKEKLPWKRTHRDEWLCMFRVAWLALLCVVLLAIVTTVIGQIYKEKHLFKMPEVPPIDFNFPGRLLHDLDGEKQTTTISLKGKTLQLYEFQSRPGLSPIQEVDSQNEIETLLDGNPDHCYTANLHHRGHPHHFLPHRGAGLVTEELPEESRT